MNNYAQNIFIRILIITAVGLFSLILLLIPIKGWAITTFKLPYIIASENRTYSDSQILKLEIQGDTLVFNKSASEAFEARWHEPDKCIYTDFTEITPTEVSYAGSYRTIDPSDGSYILVNGINYLARIWDPAWWQIRYNSIPRISNWDCLFLDVMRMNKPPWITDTLPIEIDTPVEWASAMTSTTQWIRNNVGANIGLITNTNDTYAETYNGYELQGGGLVDYRFFEIYLSGAPNPSGQLLHTQVLAKATELQKNIIVHSEVDPTIDTSSIRLDYFGKYLIAANPQYTNYMVSSFEEWNSSAVPLYIPELEINLGNPTSPIPPEIVNNNVAGATILLRTYENGWVALLNTTAFTQNIPNQYLNHKMLQFSGDIRIDTNGYSNAKWDLSSLVNTTIPAYKSIVLYLDTVPPSAPTGLVIE